MAAPEGCRFIVTWRYYTCGGKQQISQLRSYMCPVHSEAIAEQSTVDSLSRTIPAQQLQLADMGPPQADDLTASAHRMQLMHNIQRLGNELSLAKQRLHTIRSLHCASQNEFNIDQPPYVCPGRWPGCRGH